MSTMAPVTIDLGGFGARADTWDFRDAVYRPNLVEVPESRPLATYRALGVPVLSQGVSQQCTGYALATVANALLRMRDQRAGRASVDVSPQMLYAMARRYDEYPGTRHQGSSIRGAMKGWHRHGVCSREAWENEEVAGQRLGPVGVLTRARAHDANSRPLGAYYRVDVDDLNAVHCALTEVGVMVAALKTHDGWYDLFHAPAEGAPRDPVLDMIERAGAAHVDTPPVGIAGARHRKVDPARGRIPWPAPNTLNLGLHAVAVVGYDRTGVWIQNSLGAAWGDGGCAHLEWDDWLENAADAWVARLGAPVQVGARHARSHGANHAASRSFAEMRPHIVPIGVDGRLQEHGAYATTAQDVRSIVCDELRAETEGWKRRRLLIVASSGLGRVDDAIRTVGDLRDPLMRSEVYPLLLLWNADFGAQLHQVVERAFKERIGEAGAGADKQARVEGSLEALVRRWGGWTAWDQVKRLAERAAEKEGALGVLLQNLDRAVRDATADGWPFEVHLAGESTGAWLLGHLVRRFTTPKDQGGFGRRIASCTLVAPACTTASFAGTFGPALDSGALARLSVVNLSDPLERSDGFAGYRGSLLTLLSNALDETPRIPPGELGTPLLGVTRHLKADGALSARFDRAEVPDDRGIAELHVLSRAQLGDAMEGGSVHGRLMLHSPAARRVLTTNLDIAEPRA